MSNTSQHYVIKEKTKSRCRVIIQKDKLKYLITIDMSNVQIVKVFKVHRNFVDFRSLSSYSLLFNLHNKISVNLLNEHLKFAVKICKHFQFTNFLSAS